MLLSILGVILACVSSQGRSLGSPVQDIVDTGYAKYLGNRTFPNVVAYLGIPYAEPPLGELRFRAPLPLNISRISQAVKGAVVDARTYPNFCVQGSMRLGDAGGAGSEDCLKINIFTPAGAKQDSNFPVLVYFHQGGYTWGNPACWPFDHWVHQSPNVVLISVYYRLSSFGFLAIPEFKNSSSLGDLNAGFLDQIEALKWVKRHVSRFGGDPNKVTIDGESAGGSSVVLHLVANEGERLFSGAIAQSVWRSPLPTPEQQVPLFRFVANHTGCGAGTVVDQLACLRKASVSALAQAQDAASSPEPNGLSYKRFRPVIDGKLFTDFPTRSIVSGKGLHVPLMVGAATNETRSFGSDLVAAIRDFFPSMRTEDLDAILTAYPSTQFASDLLRFQTITGDLELRAARLILATAYAQRAKAWAYRYNQRNPTQDPALGVAHAAENWMMFRGTNPGFNGTTTFTAMTAVENAFAEELIAYWLSFVRTGDPNTHKLARSPVWEAYVPHRRSRIVLQQDRGNTSTASGSFVELEEESEKRRTEVIINTVGSQQN